jgi:hypothetical protein
MDGERTNAFCPYAMAFIRWRMLWEGCGTPRYLFAPAATDYYGVIGWHLSRPSLAPEHWSTPTKAWVESHIYAATCVVSYNDMLAWAKAKYQTGNFTWERPKSPVNYTCLWAVAGRGCRHRPAEVYYPPPKLDVAKSLIEYADDHWLRHQAAIAGLQR